MDTILAHESIEDGKSYYPVIKYELEGKVYVKEIRSISGKFYVGDTVDIIYNSENPDIVNIKPSIIYAIGGIIFVVAGIFLMKKNKEESN